MIQVLHLTLLPLKILNEFNPAGLFEFITIMSTFHLEAQVVRHNLHLCLFTEYQKKHNDNRMICQFMLLNGKHSYRLIQHN